MPRLKNLSSKEIIKILEKFGFKAVGQKGSHIKMARVNFNGKELLTIPNHSEIAKGTLKSIFRQTTRYISETELREYFYSE